MIAYRYNVAPSRPTPQTIFTEDDLRGQLHRLIARAGSQTEVAHQLGLHKGTLSKILRGASSVSANTAYLLGFERSGNRYRRLPQ